MLYTKERVSELLTDLNMFGGEKDSSFTTINLFENMDQDCQQLYNESKSNLSAI